MRKIILVLFTACSLKYRAFALLLLTVFFSFQCSKPKDAAKTEIDQLPPATQNGANTFGCLVNGKAWTPNGFFGNAPHFMVIADPGYYGNLDMRAYRFVGGKIERISIFCFDVSTEGTYKINGINRIWVNYSSDVSNCYFYRDSINYVSGTLLISQYDLQNGIVSGEFNCTLYDKTTVCDTVRITNGRFDYKL